MPNNEASLEGGPKKIIYAKSKSILRGRNLSQNYLFALGILYNYNLYNPIVFYFQSYIILHIQTKTQLSVCHMSLNLWKHDETDDSVSLLGWGRAAFLTRQRCTVVNLSHSRIEIIVIWMGRGILIRTQEMLKKYEQK